MEEKASDGEEDEMDGWLNVCMDETPLSHRLLKHEAMEFVG